MSKPAHVQRLIPDLGADHVTGERQILHVEMVGGPYGAARHIVLGEQQRTRFEPEIG